MRLVTLLALSTIVGLSLGEWTPELRGSNSTTNGTVDASDEDDNTTTDETLTDDSVEELWLAEFLTSEQGATIVYAVCGAVCGLIVVFMAYENRREAEYKDEMKKHADKIRAVKTYSAPSSEFKPVQPKKPKTPLAPKDHSGGSLKGTKALLKSSVPGEGHLTSPNPANSSSTPSPPSQPSKPSKPKAPGSIRVVEAPAGPGADASEAIPFVDDETPEAVKRLTKSFRMKKATESTRIAAAARPAAKRAAAIEAAQDENAEIARAKTAAKLAGSDGVSYTERQMYLALQLCGDDIPSAVYWLSANKHKLPASAASKVPLKEDPYYFEWPEALGGPPESDGEDDMGFEDSDIEVVPVAEPGTVLHVEPEKPPPGAGAPIEGKASTVEIADDSDDDDIPEHLKGPSPTGSRQGSVSKPPLPASPAKLQEADTSASAGDKASNTRDQESAAVALQAAFRGFKARKEVKQMKAQKPIMVSGGVQTEGPPQVTLTTSDSQTAPLVSDPTAPPGTKSSKDGTSSPANRSRRSHKRQGSKKSNKSNRSNRSKSKRSSKGSKGSRKLPEVPASTPRIPPPNSSSAKSASSAKKSPTRSVAGSVRTRGGLEFDPSRPLPKPPGAAPAPAPASSGNTLNVNGVAPPSVPTSRRRRSAKGTDDKKDKPKANGVGPSI